jgi:DNA adenine methylase
MTPARPVLRYHGSKWRLAQWILSYFPPHKIYVEPFGGGASVLLRKRPATQEIYNDLDQEIVNVFRVMRDPVQAEELRRLLFYTPHSRAEYDLSYEAAACPVETARRTIVRAYMGHGSNSATGQYKYGFRGKRMGSAGPALDWSRYESCIPGFVGRLRTVTLECSPAVDILRKYDSPDTLFYVDPPYLRNTRTTHGDSYRYEMSELEHVELSGLLHGLSGMVLLSGYASDLYNGLYADWRAVSKEAQIEGAAKRTEILWISPNADRELRPGLLQAVAL